MEFVLINFVRFRQRQRFECLSDAAQPSRLDYMQAICIDGGLEPQPNKPGAKASCVFKIYSSYSSASVILECESSRFAKNHRRLSKGVLIYISSPPVIDSPPRTGIITHLFWPPVLLQKHQKMNLIVIRRDKSFSWSSHVFCLTNRERWRKNQALLNCCDKQIAFFGGVDD